MHPKFVSEAFAVLTPYTMRAFDPSNQCQGTCVSGADSEEKSGVQEDLRNFLSLYIALLHPENPHATLFLHGTLLYSRV